MPSINNRIYNQTITDLIDTNKRSFFEQRKTIKVLKELERDLKINTLDFNLNFRRKTTLNNFLKEASFIIGLAYQDIYNLNRELLEEIAEFESRRSVNLINDALGIFFIKSISANHIIPQINNMQIEGAPVKVLWKRQARRVQEKFNDKIRIGITKGDNTENLIKSIVGTKALQYKDGIFKTAKRGTETLIRTSIMAGLNTTRLTVFEQNTDIIKGYVHISTLDLKTSGICKQRSGLTWNTNKEPENHSISFQNPPVHWNCRSTLVPILKSWDELSNKTKSNIDKKAKSKKTGLRASMDGTVPADLTYEEWLKTKSDTFQKRILGEEKFKKWKDGNLNFSDLLK